MVTVSDVEIVAKALKVSPATVRKGLEQGVFPFGCAVQCERRYSYIFFKQKVKEYLGVDLNGKD